MIHSGSWRGYAGLVDIGYDKHDCIHHSHNEFACGDKHINTELRAFGVMPREGLPSSMEYQTRLFICTSKKLSLGSITGMAIYTLRLSKS